MRVRRAGFSKVAAALFANGETTVDVGSYAGAGFRGGSGSEGEACGLPRSVGGTMGRSVRRRLVDGRNLQRGRGGSIDICGGRETWREEGTARRSTQAPALLSSSKRSYCRPWLATYSSVLAYLRAQSCDAEGPCGADSGGIRGICANEGAGTVFSPHPPAAKASRARKGGRAAHLSSSLSPPKLCDQLYKAAPPEGSVPSSSVQDRAAQRMQLIRSTDGTLSDEAPSS